MEKKRTQRIIGILVVIALIVIMLPLIFGKNNVPPIQQATVKAPAPLDQEPNWPVQDEAQSGSSSVATVQAAATALPTSSNPAASNDTTEQASAAQSTGTVAKTSPVPAKTATATTTTTTVTTTATVAPVVTTEQQPAKPMTDAALAEAAKLAAAPAEAVPAKQSDTIIVQPSNAAPNASAEQADGSDSAKLTINEDGSIVSQPKPAPKPVAAAPVKPKVASKAHHPATHSSSAWVVQMGSFKVKSNAEKLATKLRAAGFKVITAQKANGTRVYIGPAATNKMTATALAHSVDAKLKLAGIVVPYASLEG